MNAPHSAGPPPVNGPRGPVRVRGPDCIKSRFRTSGAAAAVIHEPLSPFHTFSAFAFNAQKKGKGSVSVYGGEKTIRLNSILPKTHLLPEWEEGNSTCDANASAGLFRLLLLKGSWAPPLALLQQAK